MTLKQKIISGTKWVTLANILGQILGIVSLIIYARLLSPDVFGIYAVLTIFVFFLAMFTDMGTAAAIIHIDNPSKKLLSSIFYFNIFIGIFLFSILTISSASISDFFNMPEVQQLLPLIAINFIFESFIVVQRALFEKSMNFKKITVIEVIARFFSLTFGITLAYLGFGVMGLVAQALLNSLITASLLWKVSKWRPSWYFSIEEIKKIWVYTSQLTSFNFINYFARNADNFIIGKFLNSHALGIYSLAYKIMLYPLQNITQVATRVLFPAFSEIKNNHEQIKNAYLNLIFIIALLIFPIMTLLMVTVDTFVEIIFGNKWQGIATILFILAPVGAMQSITSTTGTLYMVKGKTNMMLKIGFINALITVIFFLIGVQFDLVGITFSYLLANFIMLYPNLMIAWKEINLTFKEGFYKILPIIIISLIMAIVILITKEYVTEVTSNNIQLLISLVLLGIFTYLLLIKLFYGHLNFMNINKEVKSNDI